MKVSAYIFVQVERGEPWDMAKEILDLEGVKTARAVTGQYDIIAFAELPNLKAMGEIVREIHNIEGVQRSQTAICLPFESLEK